jgi:hypothetical protein
MPTTPRKSSRHTTYTLEIDLEVYRSFAECVANGFGTIVAWDVKRQWDLQTNDDISPSGLAYLIANLDANGLIGEDDGE